MMRVLWLVRSNLRSRPGGDTTQILRTQEALHELGVQVTLSSESQPRLLDYDLVHLFHLDRVWENVHWCRQIRAAGTPAALSPIYWPTEEFDRKGRTGWERAVGGGYCAGTWWRRVKRLLRSNRRRMRLG